MAGLNEYTLANRGNRFGGSKFKKDQQRIVTNSLPKRRPKMKYPVELDIKWYEKDNRRDVDNVCFAVKMILDALVNAGVLEDDARRFVRGISHEVFTDKANPRIEVSIFAYKEE